MKKQLSIILMTFFLASLTGIANAVQGYVTNERLLVLDRDRDTSFRVSGQVIDSNKRPAADATVRLQVGNDGQVQEYSTRENGAFSFSLSPAPGNQTIFIDAFRNRGEVADEKLTAPHPPFGYSGVILKLSGPLVPPGEDNVE